MYLEGGIRTAEIGSLMFGSKDKDGNPLPAQMELVRLAFPRRVYTQSHFDVAAEAIIDCYQNREKARGMKLTYEPPFLRHFTCDLAPV